MNPYNNPEARFIKKIRETCEKNNLNTNEDLIQSFLNNRINYQNKSTEIPVGTKEKNSEINTLLNLNDLKVGELMSNNINFNNNLINDKQINSIYEKFKINEKSFRSYKDKINENSCDDIDMNIINENSMSTIINNNSNKNPFLYKVKAQNKNKISEQAYKKNQDFKGKNKYMHII
jgi:hypothetical protein